MTKAEGVDGQTNGEEEDAILTVAGLYAAAFPHADLPAIQAFLELVRAQLEVALVGNRFLARLDPLINASRYSMLRALYLAPDRQLAQAELARLLQTTPGNVTQLMDVLKRNGMAERMISPENRRITFARLTPAGVAQAERLVPAMVGFMEQTCSALSDDEKIQLRDLLIKYRASVRTILLVQ